jgi:hypothetical protein
MLIKLHRCVLYDTCDASNPHLACITLIAECIPIRHMPLKIASPVSSQTSQADLLEETDGIIWATIEVPLHER